MATGDKLIQVKDLKKYYNRGAIKALDGVTVDIDRGDVMVVIGPSGSGKSTFLRSLNLLEEPTGGSIIFNGVDITKKKIKNAEGKTVKVDIDQHRQKMGMVFQHFNLFPHMTIMDNMTLAPIQVKHMDRGEAEKKALAFYADGRISALVGTHTHVQTADGQILPKGTGFLSDAGMTGPVESVLGIRPELAIAKMRDKLPVRFATAPGPCMLNAVLFVLDDATGRTVEVQTLDLR